MQNTAIETNFAIDTGILGTAAGRQHHRRATATRVRTYPRANRPLPAPRQHFPHVPVSRKFAREYFETDGPATCLI